MGDGETVPRACEWVKGKQFQGLIIEL